MEPGSYAVANNFELGNRGRRRFETSYDHDWFLGYLIGAGKKPKDTKRCD